MRNPNIVLTLLLVSGIIFCSSAQSKREKKWNQAILALEKSDFMLEYDKVRNSIEEQVGEFHRQKAGLLPADKATVRKGYESTVAQFDKILEDLKGQFTNPVAREVIANHPDQFTRYMEVSLNDAVTHYNNQCKLQMDELINYNKGVFGIMEVGILIQLSKELMELWSKQAENSKKMSADFFEREFVTQHRLKKWENY